MGKRRSGLVFYEKKKIVSKALVAEILSWFFYTLIAVLVAWLLANGFGYSVFMRGSSMLPEIKNGQRVLIDRVLYRLRSPGRGDIIAFYPNGNESAHLMIRRIVGLPGETVRIEDGIIYINDKPATDQEHSYDRIADAGIAANGITLRDKDYFVLGDLRNIGEDSRSPQIGNVSKDAIVGKAWLWMGASQ